MKRVTWLKIGFLCLATCFPNGLVAQVEITPGKVIDGVPTADNQSHTYALYLPSNYREDQTWPLLLLFDPGAVGVRPVTRFSKAAEAHGFIVASSNLTQNYVAWEKNAVAVRDFWKDVSTRFKVNPKLIFAGGFSGGARLTTRVATLTGQMAGVVLCGAGFHVQNVDQLNISFPVITTVGSTDMNWLELRNLEKSLGKAGVENRRIAFNGGHIWPPEPDCHDVLGWFYVSAAKRGLVSLDEERVNGYLAWRDERARTVYDAGDVAAAVNLDRQIAEDFAGLADLSAVEQRLEEFGKSESVAADMRALEAAEQMESLYRRDMLTRMSQGEAQPPTGPVELNRALNWWREVGGRMAPKRNSTENPREAEAVMRLFTMVSSLVFEKSVYAQRQKNWNGMIYLNSVAATMVPPAAYPYYNLGVAFAAKGDADSAIEYLQKYVTYPNVSVQSLEGDANFQPLWKDPRWNTLIKGE